MSLLLALYNESMRLGQGFNSYTQESCLDSAVTVPAERIKTAKSPSQIVSYSSRCVEKLSDVVDSMNVSYSAAIKKGTVEISGNAAVLDETNFKSADLNAIVSVRVINQTTAATDNCVFKGIEGVPPGSSKFNDIYGDCYISGFMKGGDFTGIISIKVLDRTRKQAVINEIKSALGTNVKDDLTLDPMQSGEKQLRAISAVRETECTVSVSWMGGGQIKNENTQWDINSMFAAAAAFPNRVAECPQRTWAILTKYRANRSFQTLAHSTSYKILQYDQISSFTAELFDNFMDYKLLLKKLQHIIRHRDAYLNKEKDDNNTTIDLSIRTLISVRSALRDEQAKIVDAVSLAMLHPYVLLAMVSNRRGQIEVLSKDPEILQRQTRNGNRTYKSVIVQKIVAEAVADMSTIEDEEEDHPETPDTSSESLTQTKGTSGEGLGRANAVGRQTEEAQSSPPQPDEPSAPKLTFDFDKLIPPEIWEDLMPRPKGDMASTTGTPTTPSDPKGSAGQGAPIPPPVGDDHVYPDVLLAQAKAELKSCQEALAKARSDLITTENQLQQAVAGKDRSDEAKTVAEKKKADAERLEREARASLSNKATELETANQRANALHSKVDGLESQKQKLESEKTTANQEIERLRVDIDSMKGRLLDGGSNSNRRIWIAAVWWGTVRIDTSQPETMTKLYELAENKQMFTPNVKFFNNVNPWLGDITFFCAYRIDKTGSLRYLVLKEGSAGQFPDW
ncbi:hypothetical protein BJ170DRAFT_598063 [Xylariales sp. AK1849]|nr:hypothetical protein BJ170DRAFT_598063 [Xylariales sp. AK1849]